MRQEMPNWPLGGFSPRVQTRRAFSEFLGAFFPAVTNSPWLQKRYRQLIACRMNPPRELAVRTRLALWRLQTFGKAGMFPPSEPAIISGNFIPSGRLAYTRLMNPPYNFSWFCSSFIHFDAKTFLTSQIT